ncbi:Hsp20/alpha crystallin family protein [Salinisphaera hydrothermalis]|uniref:Small heat shock protein,HSP20 n=1 Tax=Salinisphaera hydrothermalis (strain C41B8) TaxID=1304275 RepID=A0A084IKI5_SALHC|nr:Hsp20/alpha crystallin family protein [Salinisphaera hydrothermalis]KEZ77219.1 small heat shock protein,HSP20 [Salinisphaera hydrothermalis C41B8]
MGQTTDKPDRDAQTSAGHRVATDDRDDWMLVVDVREFADHYVIRAELPGVAAGAIKVAVEDGMLLLSGERPRVWHDPQRPHPGACGQRHFARSISLPFDADSRRFDVAPEQGAVEVRFARLYAPVPDALRELPE